MRRKTKPNKLSEFESRLFKQNVRMIAFFKCVTTETLAAHAGLAVNKNNNRVSQLLNTHVEVSIEEATRISKVIGVSYSDLTTKLVRVGFQEAIPQSDQNIYTLMGEKVERVVTMFGKQTRKKTSNNQ